MALAGWTKFASLLLAPLWLTYPNGLRPRSAARFAVGVRRGDAGGVLDPAARAEPRRRRCTPSSTARSATSSTATRRSRPGTGASTTRRASRTCTSSSSSSRSVSLALAGVVAAIPRRKGPLELAALSAAVLVGFELALTHWSYLYIPWFCPFVLLALLLPLRRGARAEPRIRARRASSSRAPAERVTSARLLVGAGCGSPRSRSALLRRGAPGRRGISRHARLPALRRAIAGGDVPYRDFSGRVPAGRAGAVRRPGARHRRASGTTTRRSRTLMVVCAGRARRADRALARRARRARRRRTAAARVPPSSPASRCSARSC